MKLAYKFQNKIDEIAEEVCKYFNVSEQQIISRDCTENVSNARYFLWYILHYEMKLSGKTLAKMYFRTHRGVFKGVAKIRSGLKTQPFYQIIYDNLYKKVELLIPEDIERFLENMEEKRNIN
jgi:chromosomal replication initiation ATPase DnaA